MSCVGSLDCSECCSKTVVSVFAEILGVSIILRRGTEDPLASKRQIGVRLDLMQDTEHNRLPLSADEVVRMKRLLGRLVPATYRDLYPSESKRKSY